MSQKGHFCLGTRRRMTDNLRHEIKQSNKGRLQERRGRLQNVLEQRRQAEVAEASTSTQSFSQASLSGTRRDTVASISSVTTQTVALDANRTLRKND